VQRLMLAIMVLVLAIVLIISSVHAFSLYVGFAINL
jgi:hypothetical protein